MHHTDGTHVLCMLLCNYMQHINLYHAKVAFFFKRGKHDRFYSRGMQIGSLNALPHFLPSGTAQSKSDTIHSLFF